MKPLPAIPGKLAIVTTKDCSLPSTTLCVAKGDAIQERTAMGVNAEQHSVAWASDGKKIAFIRVFDLQIQIVDFEHGVVGSLPQERYREGVAWAPNGDCLAVCTLDLSPAILSLTKNTVAKIPGCKPICSFMAWSPNGRWIAMVCNNDVLLVDPNGGQSPLKLCTLPIQNTLAWSPDSKKILIAGSPNLSVVDVASHQVSVIPSPQGDYLNPSWSPDGKWIAFGYTDVGLNSQVLIHIMQPDGTGFKQISKPNQGFGRYGHNGPSWSPDSKFIAFHSSRGSGDMSGVSNPDNAIYIASIDGVYYGRITPKDAQDLNAVWSPR